MPKSRWGGKGDLSYFAYIKSFTGVLMKKVGLKVFQVATNINVRRE